MFQVCGSCLLCTIESLGGVKGRGTYTHTQGKSLTHIYIERKKNEHWVRGFSLFHMQRGRERGAYTVCVLCTASRRCQLLARRPLERMELVSVPAFDYNSPPSFWSVRHDIAQHCVIHLPLGKDDQCFSVVVVVVVAVDSVLCPPCKTFSADYFEWIYLFTWQSSPRTWLVSGISLATRSRRRRRRSISSDAYATSRLS